MNRKTSLSRRFGIYNTFFRQACCKYGQRIKEKEDIYLYNNMIFYNIYIIYFSNKLVLNKFFF